MCSVQAGTSVDHFTEDKLVNRALQMQSLNSADLDKTTLGKPQKPGVEPNIPQDSSEKLVKKAMTMETRAYIILAAVAACMGFLLIWWKAMQKVTQNGNLSLPLLNESLIKSDLLQPAVDQPAPKTSASVYAEQRQQKEYKQPMVEQHAAAIDNFQLRTSAPVITEQHLGAIEGYSADEITKIRQYKKVIAEQRHPLITRQWESMAKSNSNSGFSKFANGSNALGKVPTAVASPASTTIRSSQASYGQLSQPFKQMSTTQSVQQTRVRSVDAPRMPVGTLKNLYRG